MPFGTVGDTSVYSGRNMMKDPFQSSVKIMQVERGCIEIQVLIVGTLSNRCDGTLGPGDDTFQVRHFLTDAPSHHKVAFNHNSMPSCSIEANNSRRQVPTSTRLMAMAVSRSITTPMARKVALGERPQAARSTSDHRVKQPTRTSEPNTITRSTLNCALRRVAAHRATSQARACRWTSSCCSRACRRRAVVRYDCHFCWGDCRCWWPYLFHPCLLGR